MLYSPLKPGYRRQLKMTPSEFCKDGHEILNIIRQFQKGWRHSTTVFHKIQDQDNRTYKNTVALKVESGISNLDQHIIHYLMSTISWLECNKELQTIFL